MYHIFFFHIKNIHQKDSLFKNNSVFYREKMQAFKKILKKLVYAIEKEMMIFHLESDSVNHRGLILHYCNSLIAFQGML